MKKLIAVVAIMIATVSMALPCECYFSVTQELNCGKRKSITTYTYCGSGIYCSNDALQAAYLEASLTLMDAALDC